jgi:hypothetical protein
MQEDIAGQRAEGIGRRYSTCAQCGRTLLQGAARAHPAGLFEDARSEFAEVCEDCERLLRQGEAPAMPVDG